MITTFNTPSNMPQIYSVEKATQRHTDYVYRVIEKTTCPPCNKLILNKLQAPFTTLKRLRVALVYMYFLQLFAITSILDYVIK